MTVDVPTFKGVFPEFASSSDTQIAFWLGQAQTNLSAPAFGRQLDMATMLYAAHYVSMSMRQGKAAAGGGIPGMSYGPMTSMSAGPVSKSMGAGLTTNARAGQWNNTSYGQQLYAIMEAVSQGPLYVPGIPSKLSGRPANGYLGTPGWGRRW